MIIILSLYSLRTNTFFLSSIVVIFYRNFEEFCIIQWNGKSDQGFSVASGMYFYQITAGHFTASRKMLLIK